MRTNGHLNRQSAFEETKYSALDLNQNNITYPFSQVNRKLYKE